MKILFILLPFLFLTQNEPFYEKVLNDFDSNSQFIFINAKSSEHNGALIIQNDKFFNFLNRKGHLNKNEYKLFIKKKLTNNSFFNLGTTDLTKWGFIKVPKLKKVENNYSKGIQNFIKIYFDNIDNNKVIKSGISDEERAAIIMILFKNQLSSYIDDETGYLVIGQDT